MERIDVSDGRRIADLVEAVERGDEVVIVRDGAVVAEVRATETAREAPAPFGGRSKPFDVAALEALHARFPDARVDDAAKLIREMRDEDRF